MRFASFSLAIALPSLALAGSAHACKCVGPSSFDAVFEGRVERLSSEANPPGRLTKVELSITRSATEPVHRTMTVYTPVPVLMCGVPFKAGHTYVVRAIRVDEHLETLDCYGTKER